MTDLHRRTSIAAIASTLASPLANAQPLPVRGVRIVVPFPPGGAGDTITRAIAARLQQSMSTPFVVDNKPGASGVIATDAVARSQPDGATVLSHASSIVIQPHLGAAPYDVLRDLIPVTQTVAGSYVLVARPDFPASSFAQWQRAVREAPGRYTYASHGSGTGPHLAMELLKREASLFIVHVPFRGAAPALREILAGRVDMGFDTTFAALPHIRAGRLKAIAVGGRAPVEGLPGVPRVADAFAGFDTDGWQGFFMPAGTPRAIVDRLAVEAAHAVRTPAIASSIADLGFRAIGSTPDEFARVVTADHERWGRLVRERRIAPD